MMVINDMAFYLSFSCARICAYARHQTVSLSSWTRNISAEGQTLNSMTAQAMLICANFSDHPRLLSRDFLAPRIATVGEHNMNEANKRQYREKC